MTNQNIKLSGSVPSEAIAISSSRVRIAATCNAYFQVGDETVQATSDSPIVLSNEIEQNMYIGENKYMSFLAVAESGTISVLELNESGNAFE